LFDESWHQGVVGILASRIKDKFHRPVIAFALSHNEESSNAEKFDSEDVNKKEIKGSARSIPNLHIRDTLDAIATQHPDVLQKFGGHAMAAGLSLQLKDYEKFSSLFDQAVKAKLSEEDFQDHVLTDGELNRARAII